MNNYKGQRDLSLMENHGVGDVLLHDDLMEVKRRKGHLHVSQGLSQGQIFEGELLGATLPVQGELIFTTGMVGHPQTLTDPSYHGQIIVFTYPLIGNYGDSGERESEKIKAAGAIFFQHSQEVYHWRALRNLDRWLKEEGVPALVGVDTRQLTQIIRNSHGPVMARISESPIGNGDLMVERPLVAHVSTKERKRLGRGNKRIAVLDYGVKWNIVRSLLAAGCEVELLPWNTPLSKQMRDVDCSGWLLSNGPGDPHEVCSVLGGIKELINEDRPMMGICLGFQLLALAAGAQTRRLPFGHRGHNHAVYRVGSKKGFMTSQNHGYEVVESTLPPEWTPWFRHLSDQTLEGIYHQEKPFFGVQFHPEAAAGPQDTAWILEDFLKSL